MSTIALREYLKTIEGDEDKIVEVFTAMQSDQRLIRFAEEKGISLSMVEAATLRRTVLKKRSEETLSEEDLEKIVGGLDWQAVLLSLQR